MSAEKGKEFFGTGALLLLSHGRGFSLANLQQNEMRKTKVKKLRKTLNSKGLIREVFWVAAATAQSSIFWLVF